MEFWISSRNIGAIYPGMFAKPLECTNVFLGRDRSGARFAYNPFELYASGVLTNPNIMVFGQIGFGKSALVKALISRHLDCGYKACVFDPKGEYEALASSSGGVTVSFGVHAKSGLNPLSGMSAAGKAAKGLEISHSLLENLTITMGAVLQREPTSLESYVLEHAISVVMTGSQEVDLYDVYHCLVDTRRDGFGQFGVFDDDAAHCAAALALELRRYLFGDLKGIIDGPKGTGAQRVSAERLIHVDLFSALRSESMKVGVPVFLTLFSKLLSRGSDRYIVALDEAWMALSNPGCSAFIRSYWKLARGYGISNVAVVHRSEDLGASGEAGSVSEKVALGLISDSQTYAIFHLDHPSAYSLGRQLALSKTETSVVGSLPRGSCLWKVGDRTFVVDVMLSAQEAGEFGTDGRMIG